jgi:hypothetical protein
MTALLVLPPLLIHCPRRPRFKSPVDYNSVGAASIALLNERQL